MLAVSGITRYSYNLHTLTKEEGCLGKWQGKAEQSRTRQGTARRVQVLAGMRDQECFLSYRRPN